MFKENLVEQRKEKIIANLKQNWYFPISAVAFFLLNISVSTGYYLAVLLAFLASFVVASQFPSMIVYAKQSSPVLSAVAFASAVGTCWAGQTYFYSNWNIALTVQKLAGILSMQVDVHKVLSIILAIFSVAFVYFMLLLVWNKLVEIFGKNGVFTGVKRSELVLYSILIMASLALMFFSFSHSEAFYGTEYFYDIIYTSDSPDLVKNNAYLILTHPENDIRQPLFAAFAAPFVGMPYLVGKLLNASAPLSAMLVNMVQIIMMFVANFVLSKVMKLSALKRAIFMLLASCTYMHLLFVLMMEQYIVAYFWLMLSIYIISKKRCSDRVVLWAASGSLLTNIVLLPFLSDKNPIRNFKEWFLDLIKFGLEFVSIIVICCRFDVIFNLTTRLSVLGTFAGKDLTLMEKFYQYSSFVMNCLIAPDAVVIPIDDYAVWRSNAVIEVNFIGVAFFLLAVVSMILNREKKSSWFAFGWIVLSVVMLLGLGWGTKENGLILYTLYFGWAFLALLFQLVEKIEDKLHSKMIVPVVGIGCTVVLAMINIPAIVKMVNFAITYFPI